MLFCCLFVSHCKEVSSFAALRPKAGGVPPRRKRDRKTNMCVLVSHFIYTYCYVDVLEDEEEENHQEANDDVEEVAAWTSAAINPLFFIIKISFPSLLFRLRGCLSAPAPFWLLQSSLQFPVSSISLKLSPAPSVILRT